MHRSFRKKDRKRNTQSITISPLRFEKPTDSSAKYVCESKFTVLNRIYLTRRIQQPIPKTMNLKFSRKKEVTNKQQDL